MQVFLCYGEGIYADCDRESNNEGRKKWPPETVDEEDDLEEEEEDRFGQDEEDDTEADVFAAYDTEDEWMEQLDRAVLRVASSASGPPRLFL